MTTISTWKILDSQKTCAICLNTKEDNKIVGHESKKITHVFHRSCIKNWIFSSKSEKCPQCFEQIDPRSLFGKLYNLHRTSKTKSARIAVAVASAVATIIIAEMISNNKLNYGRTVGIIGGFWTEWKETVQKGNQLFNAIVLGSYWVMVGMLADFNHIHDGSAVARMSYSSIAVIFLSINFVLMSRLSTHIESLAQKLLRRAESL